MAYLIASLLALAFGPFLAIWARRFRPSTIAVDSFVLVVLGGLVVLHILPHALEATGLWALLVAAAGFFVTGSAERSLRSGAGASRLGRRMFFALALAGLGIHAVIDGMALVGADLPHDHAAGEPHEHGSIWALAVLLHRVPFAISLWWIVAPLIGVRTAVLSMTVIAVGTVIGYAVGEDFLATASPSTLGLFEALLCGTLLHVVLHADLPPAPKGADPWLTRVATLCGLAGGGAVVALVEHGHDHGITAAGDGHDHGMGATFLELALESAPALLLAYFAVGLAHAFLPADFLGGRARGKGLGGALRGVAIGIPLPVCSCGVVPMYRDLVRRGAGVAAGIAFLVATPELEFAAILLTWNLLGPDIAIARTATAALLALGVAVAVARCAPATAEAADTPSIDERPLGLGPRVRRALHTGFIEAVDETSAWILLGLGVAAFLTPLLDPSALAGVPSLVAVPAAALLGMPLYVCASGSTPLAAVLVAKGLSPGAAIAFLLTGPATNVTTFGMLSRLHDRRTATAFALLMFVGATLAGLATDALLAADPAPPGAAGEHVHQHGSVLQWVCLAALALVVAASLLRQGIRRYVGQLLDTPSLAELTGSPEHDDHSHSCCH
ncbi:MAG: permease [Planctomycetota bacterium]|nr:permease [Planctomycetota bacterium]MDA0933793.1 permease [Planctomycetota bacterium]